MVINPYADGDSSATIKHFKKLLELYPDNEDARLEIGLAYKQQGKLSEAEKYLAAQNNKFPSIDNTIALLRDVKKARGTLVIWAPPPPEKVVLNPKKQRFRVPDIELPEYTPRVIRNLYHELKEVAKMEAEGYRNQINNYIKEKTIYKIPGVKRSFEMVNAAKNRYKRWSAQVNRDVERIFTIAESAGGKLADPYDSNSDYASILGATRDASRDWSKHARTDMAKELGMKKVNRG